MRTTACIPLTALVLFVLLVTPAFAKDELPPPHPDDVVEAALERFEQDYAEDDLDGRINILRWLGKHRHKDVMKRLGKIWLKESNLELVAAAAEGLAYQTSTPKKAGRLLEKGLDQYESLAGKAPNDNEERLQEDLEARVIVNGIKAIGALGYDAKWKLMKGFVDHNNDDVAIAVIELFALQKDYRALPIVYQWFEHYPDGVSWSGGSVRVDTGAAGNKDANAAKAKWKAKYGGRARKARPNAFAAMVDYVKTVTGVEIKKRDELKDWMDENKALLRKHGV